MNLKYKRPDKKNALSIVEAAKRDMEFTLSINVSEESGPTIIRNIYECFRMLGDALMINRGIISYDHSAPISELSQLKVKTIRPLMLIEQLKRLRHNINYYGYKPELAEIFEAIALAKALFKPLFEEVLSKISK